MDLGSQILMGMIGIGILLSPILVAIAWLVKASHPLEGGYGWRRFLLWITLVVVTISIGIAWSGILSSGNPYQLPHLRLRIRLTVLTSSIALVCSSLGKGRGRWLLLASSLFTPLTWVMYFAWL